ncbi:MAG: septum formation initiator family protein [Endozoicomonadaceae bacterium]|nr:septum formation initiator family protein [Endozoicomonadaceae bacterium]MCY4330442.1 septum formation initiator family protein [Endozoicomonadaceae bacterium]
MRSLTLLLWLLLLLFQHQLWFGHYGIYQLIKTNHTISQQQTINDKITARNQQISHRIIQLQNNDQRSVEAYAREELGMIRRNETFYFMPYQ